ncbi:DPH3 homolog isoform X2 [Gopherus evgoodei]|uniref:DPH3 homolog isoform X2 n=1 Tax=Gopherus evgoodei TaxID=1825980 RepID=UPI0011CED5B4|nr:DPH3 homolog isoform X2 [Gopherus evgoodei]
MSVFHDEVEIEDFEYDEETETYSYPCPCGDRFLITRVRPQSVCSEGTLNVPSMLKTAGSSVTSTRSAYKRLLNPG